MNRSVRGLLPIVVFALLAWGSPAARAMLEGSFLYFPTHEPNRSRLTEWRVDGNCAGYARIVAAPRAVWLVFHGNAGQASDRQYIVDLLPADACVYILEYPGYGLRPGEPSMAAINAAACRAYSALRTTHPILPVNVLGESLGSGAASFVCSQPNPPDRLVLIVPFDNLLSVAKQQISFLPVTLLMRDKWDNVKALSGYRGPVDIFGALQDNVIPVDHARALAKSIPQARYVELPGGGHNDWSQQPQARITD